MSLKLKHPHGWFAAGREVATALEALTDGAFKLYVYICLNAQRSTGRLAFRPGDLARSLKKSPRSIASYLAELEDKMVVRLERAANQHQITRLEVAEAYWPYEKATTGTDPNRPSDYVEQVRARFSSCPCVASSFTEADRRLALEWQRQGVSLVEIERALVLGCVRKYQAELNGKTPCWIKSLRYFQEVLEEVRQTVVSVTYWEYLASKLEVFEQQWLEKTGCAGASPSLRSAHAKFAEAKSPEGKETK